MTSFHADAALLDGLGDDADRWAEAFIAITEQDTDATAFDPEWVSDWFEYALQNRTDNGTVAPLLSATAAAVLVEAELRSAGVWCAVATASPHTSGVLPFRNEIEALRYAVENGVKARFVDWGDQA